MDQFVLWSIILFLLALGLYITEFFVPSGGFIGVIATLCLIASIGVGFSYHRYLGVALMAGAVVTVPAIFYGAIKLWPHTMIGRMVLLPRPKHQDDVLPQTEAYHRQHLVGKHGRAKTKMLPSGDVVIEGKTYDAISEGMPIDAGDTIRVAAVRGNCLVVIPSTPLTDATADDQPVELTPYGCDDIPTPPSDTRPSIDMSELDDPLA